MEDLFTINEDYDLVILKDEQGKDCYFEHLLTFIYDSDRYSAIMPIEKIEGVEDNEVVFVKIIKNNGEDIYETVTNGVLLDELFEEFMQLINEMECDEDEE